MPTKRPSSPFVLRFVGASGVGKTTLIEALLRSLRGQGIAVGVIKHSAHRHPLESAQSDSARLGVAAGGPAAFVTPGGMVLSSLSLPLPELVSLAFSDCEVVLVEGWRGEATPVVRMLLDNTDLDRHRACSGTVFGWLVRDGSPAPGPGLPQDPALLAGLIVGWARRPSAE